MRFFLVVTIMHSGDDKFGQEKTKSKYQIFSEPVHFRGLAHFREHCHNILFCFLHMLKSETMMQFLTNTFNPDLVGRFCHHHDVMKANI